MVWVRPPRDELQSEAPIQQGILTAPSIRALPFGAQGCILALRQIFAAQRRTTPIPCDFVVARAIT